MATRLFISLLGMLVLAGCGANRPGPTRSSLPGALDYLDPASEWQAEAHARYANGVLKDLAGQPQEAALEFYKAALADPGSERLVVEVSRRLRQEKMFAEAVEVLEKATSGPNASAALHAQLGLSYALVGAKQEAINANRQAIRKAPAELQSYRNLATLYLQENEGARAWDVLDEAARQKDVSGPYLLELADLYIAFGKSSEVDSERFTARGVEVLARARKEVGKNALLLQKMAESYHAAGQEETARELYVELLELLPDVPGVRDKLIEIYLRNQQTDRAAPLLEQLVKDHPTNPRANYFLGAIALGQGRAEQAAEHLNRAILLDADLEPAYYDLASALLVSDNPKKALDTLEEARRRFPRKFALEYYMGVAYNRLQDHTSALSHFVAAEVIARATEPERLTHGFYFQVGAVSERNKQYEEAERYFRKCLEMAPDFSPALNYLGYMWAERDTNLQEAKELIEKALAIEPENAAYLDSLGWVFYKLGQNQEALRYIERAIEKSEEPDATLFDHLGDIHLKLNEVDKAIEAWKKSLELEPNATIQEKLERAGASPKT